MGSLFSLVDIAKSALDADQSALNTTASNVANQNTPGYTREIPNFVAEDVVRLNGTYQIAGVGTVPPTSVRDRVLEQRVEQQTQVQAQSATVQSALSDVENIFGLTASETSSSLTVLGSAVNSFFTSLTALASDPADNSTRQQVLGAASTLATTFNSASSQITQIANGLSSEAVSIAGQVNALLSTIAGLNTQIASADPHQDAGVLEDQRQLAIAQLSQFIGLDQITTSHNGIELTTSNAGLLVSGASVYPLTTALSGGTVEILAGPENTNVTAGLTGGSLGGTLTVLQTSLPPIVSNLDTLAYSIATAVNTQNGLGIDANGNPGQALFTIGTTAPGSAAGIAVATTDPDLVAAAGVGEGSAGNTNATALAALSTAGIVGGVTATSYLASSLSQIGEAAATANNDQTAQQASLTQLTTQRNQLSGVSLDEEASNLTTYQRSYQAASQLFSIIDTLLVSSINLGVEVAVN